MPKPGRPIIFSEFDATDRKVMVSAAVILLCFFALLGLCINSEIEFRRNPPGSQCWHGVLIGSNDRC
jgi:hypothetical protein